MPPAASLWVKLGLTDKEFSDGLKRAERDLKRFGDRLSGLGSRMTNGLSLPMLFASGAAIKMSADMETASVAFTTLIGDSKKAQAQLTQLKEFAKKTPFQFPELVDATRRMMALGFASEQTLPMLRVLGDAVAGLGTGKEGLDRIVLALGQMKQKGQTMSQEMRQLSESGIASWQYLADSLGVSVSKAMDMVEQRMVSGGQGVKAVLEGIANDPKFKDGMEKQSKTLAGIWSNFKDSLGFALADIGDQLVKSFDIKGKLQGFIDGLQAITNWFANLNPAVREFIVNIMLWTAATGPLLIAFGKLITAFSAIAGLLRLIPTLGLIKFLGDARIYFSGAAQGAWGFGTALKALSVSFTPFLVGGAIIAGIGTLAHFFYTMAENARIAKLEIANIDKLTDATKKKNAITSEIERLNNKKTAATSKNTHGGWTAGGIGSWSAEDQAALDNQKKALEAIEAVIKKISESSKSGTSPKWLEDLQKVFKDLDNGETPGESPLEKLLGKSKEFLANYGTEGMAEIDKIINEMELMAYSGGKTNEVLEKQLELFYQIREEMREQSKEKPDYSDQIAQFKSFSGQLEKLDNVFAGIKKGVDFGKFVDQKMTENFKKTVGGILDNFKDGLEKVLGMLGDAKFKEELKIQLSGMSGSEALGGLIGGITAVFADVGNKIQEYQKKSEEMWQRFIDKAPLNSLFAELREKEAWLNNFFNMNREKTAKEIEDLRNRLKGIFEIDFSVLTNSVKSAFSESTIADFGTKLRQNLYQNVTNALTNAFLAGSVMKPLFDNLSNYLMTALENGLNDAEIGKIKEMVEQIYGEASPFFEVLKNLTKDFGILDSTTNKLNESILNAPQGFRVEPYSFNASTPTQLSTSSSSATYNNNSTTNITIVSNNPEQTWNDLKPYMQRDNIATGGVTVNMTPSYATGG